jgi:hypothetical protein
MAEKEKMLAEKIAALPDALQDRFLDKVDGATLALDLMAEKTAAGSSADPAKSG